YFALRALTSAAPLKQACRKACRTIVRALRALTSAAPLKRLEGFCVVRAGDSSPRSHERGPIEAKGGLWADPEAERSVLALSRAGPICCDAIRFFSVETLRHSPRSHERGPIEAIRPIGTSATPPFSPRSHERRPIEANRKARRGRLATQLSALSRARPH